MHLLVIAGPTATGKTALAVELAHSLGTDIISSDSRQVYRGLDLGTGKDLEEYRRFAPAVPYHLIDIVDPEEGYSLYQYQQACYGILDAGNPAGVMVMAGGTGMYMESVLRRYRIANVPENPELRADLTGRSREELEMELRKKDPALAMRTDLSSAKRIIRALEIWQAGLSGDIGFGAEPTRDFTFTVFATQMERTALRNRIDTRLKQRLAAGMIEEVEGLLRRGVSPDRMQVLGMEYREITDYLQGRKTRERMEADLGHEIHLLAKRQETYFRGMERRGVPVTWIDPAMGADPIREIWERKQAEND